MYKNFFIITFLYFFLFSNQVAADNWFYTFKSGDTIWDLSHSSLIDWQHWDDIVKLNKIKNEYTIQPGTQIKIPLKWAKQRSSKITSKHCYGKVTIRLKNSRHVLPLKPGMRISIGDSITTDKNSNAVLVLEDGTKLNLLEQSELSFTIARSLGGDKINSLDIQAHIKKGRADIYANPHKNPDNRFEIQTIAGNSAVRGTQFRINASDTTTKTEVLSGRILVSNTQGKISLPAGFGTIAAVGKKPLPPVVLLAAPDLKQLSALIRYLPVRFSFPEKKKAAGYRIQLSSPQKPDKIILDRVVKNSLSITQDLADGQYHLSVRAIDKNGLEGKTAFHLFQLDAQPVAPFQQKPEDGQTQQVGEVMFKWSEPLNIPLYLLEVSTQADFSIKKDLIQEKISTQSYTLTLEQPGSYYWRVSSIDNNDHQGPPGDISRVNLIPVPEKPELAPPAINDDTLILKWRDAGEGIRYHIQFSNNPDFSSLIADKTIVEPRFELPRPASGFYYLRVKLIDSENYAGAYSAVQKIDVAPKSYWPAAAAGILFLLLAL